ncbi:MAG: hypothetical protein ACO3YQ_08635, partial [Flavobacteriales bacterium]
MKAVAMTGAVLLLAIAGLLRAQTPDGAALLNQEVILEQGIEVRQEEPFERWTVIPLYSIGAFNDGRSAWQEIYTEILYQPLRNLIVGGSIDIMQRPPSGTDILYSGIASWYPIDYLELHTKLSFCPDPQFAPNQIYQGGFEWLVAPRLMVLFDYTQYNFSSVAPLGPGSIQQLRPGISWWFTDDIFLTLRYSYGYAFDEDNYNYYGGTLNFWNMPGGGRLSVGLAYGTDPDIDFGSGDPSLSNAWIGTLFYQQPITDDFAVIA